MGLGNMRRWIKFFLTSELDYAVPEGESGSEITKFRIERETYLDIRERFPSKFVEEESDDSEIGEGDDGGGGGEDEGGESDDDVVTWIQEGKVTKFDRKTPHCEVLMVDSTTESECPLVDDKKNDIKKLGQKYYMEFEGSRKERDSHTVYCSDSSEEEIEVDKASARFIVSVEEQRKATGVATSRSGRTIADRHAHHSEKRQAEDVEGGGKRSKK